MKLSSILVLALSASAAPMARMDCGTANVCGVLTLESGLGTGNYKHDTPVVHGLWPQVKPYGNSDCLLPSNSSSNPTKVYSCYKGKSTADQYSFEIHEWSKHGKCAGVTSADDFFNQICALAKTPLAAMSKGTNLLMMAATLQKMGYDIVNSNPTGMELQLAACQVKSTGKWVLTPRSTFSKVCGGGSPPPSPSPGPGGQVCMQGQQGPKCAQNSDCAKLKGCVRCAKSGFCTNIPAEMTN